MHFIYHPLVLAHLSYNWQALVSSSMLSTHLLSVPQLASASDMLLPSSPNTEEILALKRLDPSGKKFISRYAPGVLVKFGSDHDVEVRMPQFIHGQLSIRTPCILHHAPFTNVIVDAWHWEEGVWYCFMKECSGVPLDIVIDGMSSTELGHIADQLLVILDGMHSYTSTTLGAITGGPYNNWTMPYPWNPPHASRSTSTTTVTYSSNSLDPSMWTSYSASSRRRDRSI